MMKKEQRSWAGPKGLLTPETQYFSSYADDPMSTPPDELHLDICMDISDDTVTEGDVQKKVLPGGKYAVMHCELTGPQEYSFLLMNAIPHLTQCNPPIIDRRIILKIEHPALLHASFLHFFNQYPVLKNTA